jgi:hypothetical protein
MTTRRGLFGLLAGAAAFPAVAATPIARSRLLVVKGYSVAEYADVVLATYAPLRLPENPSTLSADLQSEG